MFSRLSVSSWITISGALSILGCGGEEDARPRRPATTLVTPTNTPTTPPPPATTGTKVSVTGADILLGVGRNALGEQIRAEIQVPEAHRASCVPNSTRTDANLLWKLEPATVAGVSVTRKDNDPCVAVVQMTTAVPSSTAVSLVGTMKLSDGKDFEYKAAIKHRGAPTITTSITPVFITKDINNKECRVNGFHRMYVRNVDNKSRGAWREGSSCSHTEARTFEVALPALSVTDPLNKTDDLQYFARCRIEKSAGSNHFKDTTFTETHPSYSCPADISVQKAPDKLRLTFRGSTSSSVIGGRFTWNGELVSIAAGNGAALIVSLVAQAPNGSPSAEKKIAEMKLEFD